MCWDGWKLGMCREKLVTWPEQAPWWPLVTPPSSALLPDRWWHLDLGPVTSSAGSTSWCVVGFLPVEFWRFGPEFQLFPLGLCLQLRCHLGENGSSIWIREALRCPCIPNSQCSALPRLGAREVPGIEQQPGLGVLGRAQIQRLDLFLIPSGAWARSCTNSPGSWEWIGNGIVPIPGGVSPLGMGLSLCPGQCHLWEWDCPHPRGSDTFRNGCPHAQGRRHLWEWDCPCVQGQCGCPHAQGRHHLWPGGVCLGGIPGAAVPNGMGCRNGIGAWLCHTEGHSGAVPARGHGWRGDRQGTSLAQLPQLYEGALPLDPGLNPGIPLPSVSWNDLDGKGPFGVTKSNPTSSIFTPCLSYQRRRPR